MSALLSVKQHGFLRGRSRTINLLTITHDIARSLEDNSQTDVIYSDFALAFDQIEDSLLLQKMEVLVFYSNFIIFLKQRQNYICYGDNHSAPIFFRHWYATSLSTAYLNHLHVQHWHMRMISSNIKGLIVWRMLCRFRTT